MALVARAGIPAVVNLRRCTGARNWALAALGVTSAVGSYHPTIVADEGIAAKLGISLTYLKRLRAERPDLWDAQLPGGC